MSVPSGMCTTHWQNNAAASIAHYQRGFHLERLFELQFIVVTKIRTRKLKKTPKGFVRGESPHCRKYVLKEKGARVLILLCFSCFPFPKFACSPTVQNTVARDRFLEEALFPRHLERKPFIVGSTDGSKYRLIQCHSFAGGPFLVFCWIYLQDQY